jgi:SAM-dependent methyltransferase
MLVRAPIVRIVDRGDTTTILGAKGARTFTGDSAHLVRAVLELHAHPLAKEALLAELAARAGAPVPASIVDELLALLVEDGALIAPVASTRPAFASRRVVLAISGAVAAIDAPSIVRGLLALGCDVRVALTKTAKQFVSIAALQALTHHQVWSGVWQRTPETPVPHINLAEWAELVLVCPASATTLSRIVAGDCSDLVSAIVTSTRSPVVIVPSMNDAMYASPPVQQNLDTLRTHGRILVHPALGVEVAHAPDARRPLLGPAPPPSAILDIVRHFLSTTTPMLPADAAGWERLWSSTPSAQLPWHADSLDAPLAAALDARRGSLLDIGTGAGTIAIEAARRGYRVTATDIAPTALARARDRAGDLPILFVLDDITRPALSQTFDVAVDCGVLHCLPQSKWPAYAEAITARVAPGGALLLVAHKPGAEYATTPLAETDVRSLLPAFTLTNASATSLARRDATLFELTRSA